MANATVVFEAVAPIVAVNDLAQALDYYQRGLGFNVAWQSEKPSRVASVCRDHVELNLSESRVSGGVPSKMYIQIVGVEAYYNQLVNAGVTPALALDDRPYGMRDFKIVDPSGNELSFGEPVSESA